MDARLFTNRAELGSVSYVGTRAEWARWLMSRGGCGEGWYRDYANGLGDDPQSPPAVSFGEWADDLLDSALYEASPAEVGRFPRLSPG